MTANREPLQLGAELYGYAGVDADIEVVRLMSAVLAAAQAPAARIDIGHVGIFRAIAEAAGLNAETEDQLLSLLQGKDVPSLRDACAGIAQPWRNALLALPELYGGPEVLVRARQRLPELAAIDAAIDQMGRLAGAVSALPVSFDLADLRGYHYHNGLVFAAYCQGFAGAIALGGRYDGAGAAFGRARPATGFSLDLRELARLAPCGKVPGAIAVPLAPADLALANRIAELRAAGEVVVEQLPGETAVDGIRIDRRLHLRDGAWVLENH
jgi:ATP phosphoribosyltransferase regulatory subunit